MRKDRKIIFSLALMMSLGMVASVNYGYAQYAIGTVYADEFENWSKAKKWWRKGAEKGNPFAQVMLGSYYALLGDGFEKPNYFLNVDGTEDKDKIQKSYAEAMKWFTLAGDQRILDDLIQDVIGGIIELEYSFSLDAFTRLGDNMAYDL